MTRTRKNIGSGLGGGLQTREEKHCQKLSFRNHRPNEKMEGYSALPCSSVPNLPLKSTLRIILLTLYSTKSWKAYRGILVSHPPLSSSSGGSAQYNGRSFMHTSGPRGSSSRCCCRVCGRHPNVAFALRSLLVVLGPQQVDQLSITFAL